MFIHKYDSSCIKYDSKEQELKHAIELTKRAKEYDTNPNAYEDEEKKYNEE
jgi:hypothetical protein